ncbi:MAG: DUF2171 domain-containing protein [Devosia sp.]|jgi:hypothetical protein
MYDLSKIKPGMTVLGADGAPVGKVASVDNDRIKLEPAGAGGHSDHSHYIPGGLVTGVEGDEVRLSATGATASLLDEEEDGTSAD